MTGRHMPFSLPRRDRGGGRDRDRPVRYIDPYYYVEELDIDPQTGYIIDPQVVFEPRRMGGSHPSLRRRYPYHGYGRPDQYARIPHIDRREDPVLPVGMPRPRKDAMLVGTALKKLHKEITKAEDEYSNFKQEFESDTSSIKGYANYDTLNSLWGQKIVGKKDKRNLEEHEEVEDDVGTKTPKEKFSDMKRRIQQAFSDAENPVVKNKKAEKSAARLLEKVYVAGQQIMDLFDKASKGPNDCKDLLNELQQLKNLIDPEAEQNKEVFKPGDCEEEQTGESESDEGQSTQGRDEWE